MAPAAEPERSRSLPQGAPARQHRPASPRVNPALAGRRAQRGSGTPPTAGQGRPGRRPPSGPHPAQPSPARAHASGVDPRRGRQGSKAKQGTSAPGSTAQQHRRDPKRQRQRANRQQRPSHARHQLPRIDQRHQLAAHRGCRPPGLRRDRAQPHRLPDGRGQCVQLGDVLPNPHPAHQPAHPCRWRSLARCSQGQAAGCERHPSLLGKVRGHISLRRSRPASRCSGHGGRHAARLGEVDCRSGRHP